VDGPLTGIRVLDLTHARAGPVAVRLLADWGADVVRVEPPAGPGEGGVTGARQSPDEQNLHRNKRSIVLDLKHEAGLALFLRLADRADVVVENFRAEVKRRLGIDYDALASRNPRLIYASISGFGQDGPYGARPGVDQIIQGMSGLMSVTGEPGGQPMRVGVAISDTSAGMFLGQGILLALIDRVRTGRGQWVHTSLLEAMMNKLDFQGARYTMSGEVPTAQGNDHPTQVPMGTFDAADGVVNVAAPSGRLWARFCRALDAESLMDDPRYRSGRARAQHRDALRDDINRLTRRHTTTTLVTRLNAAGVPCGPINDIGQAFEDEQVRHLRMALPAAHATLGDLSLIRSPINLSSYPHPARLDRAAPDVGADTVSVLSDLGLDAEAVARLRAAGALG
jgi:crotonobetainyl-CoA:carnitine CoA-transferase CaiB-like acyl-CoA transferase